MKRLLAFLLLLAAGIGAMWWAIGDEDAVRANGTDETAPPAAAGPPGVGVRQGRVGASVTQSGPLELKRWRSVPLGDGRVRREEAFVLTAADSQPVAEGLQRLTGVVLRLYDDASHAATVTAEEAFVELGRDANGQPTIDEQKEFDLRRAVVTSEPGSRMAGLRLELGDARVQLGDDEVRLTTGPAQPVRLVVEGENPATLVGRGAKARLPRDRASGLQRADVEILSEPVLETADLRVEAKGRMRYVEDTVGGGAQVTLDDEVQLDLARAGVDLPGLGGAPDGGGGADGGPARSFVRGDQFTGWLLRTPGRPGERDGRAMVWQRLVLVGAPATVEAPGIRVDTPRLTVLPGPLGEPFVVTAHGGESRVRQTELRSGKGPRDPVVGVSPRRIHLLRPADGAGALHRALGFPRWTLRSLERQQVVVFEAGARLESGTRTLRASDGLLVVRRVSGTSGVVQGFGDVEVRQAGEPDPRTGAPRPDLVARGSDGLRLLVGEGFERLEVGPRDDPRAARWREHRYDVAYGEARARGAGGCVVTRSPDGTRVSLAAPFDEIEADFPPDGLALRRVRTLDAALEADVLTALDVTGLPLHATLDRGGERALARAPRLLQIGPRSLRLLPMPADESPWSDLSELDRTPRLERRWREPGRAPDAEPFAVEVLGPRIDVHHAGGRAFVVDANASGDDLPRVYARLPQPGEVEPTTVACAAERLRILPFALPPDVRRMHLAGAAGPVADVVFHSLARPWLLVDRVRDFELDDARQGHVEGIGERLFVAQGGAAALFVGDPDAQTPATVRRTREGRTVEMQGARVQVHRDDAVRLAALGSFADRSTFLQPTMTLHEPGATGLLSHMRAVCRGNIHVDPDAVRFEGPVNARGIRPDGDDDPDGVQIEAEQLEMQRLAATGEVVLVTGRDVVVDWTRLDARAAEVELDLRRNRCVAYDPDGAEVDLPDGRWLRSRRIEVNYDTWSISMGAGRLGQRGSGREGER